MREVAEEVRAGPVERDPAELRVPGGRVRREGSSATQSLALKLCVLISTSRFAVSEVWALMTAAAASVIGGGGAGLGAGGWGCVVVGGLAVD